VGGNAWDWSVKSSVGDNDREGKDRVEINAVMEIMEWGCRGRIHLGSGFAGERKWESQCKKKKKKKKEKVERKIVLAIVISGWVPASPTSNIRRREK
jgi:hypothetical protein